MALAVGRRTRSLGLLGLSVIASLLAGMLLPTADAREPGDLPTIRLLAASDHLTIVQSRKFGLATTVPVYVASTGGSYELWAERQRFSQLYTVRQVERDTSGVIVDSAATELAFDALGDGLPKFSHLTLTNATGEIVKTRDADFCPNSYLPQRVNDKGPENPTYPEVCYPNPFTSGMVWGVDRGWAATLGQTLQSRNRLPVGLYTLTVEIAPFYQEALELAPEASTATFDVSIMNKSDVEPHLRVNSGHDDENLTRENNARKSLTKAALQVPGVEARPDLVALPAWGMDIDNRRDGRSFLRFGATVWNAGPSPLVVEGFRETADNTVSETMKAYQYFFQDGIKVGRAFSGRLEYDNHDGHDHWHFRDFASYSLLNENSEHVVRSGKEAFCLAPTDLIDLTVEGAEFRPFLTGLATACGESDSLWIREVLAAGWGDTYAQYRPGQSFNITRLPNGKYFVKVLANPDDRLYETTNANNVALRRIFIKGPPGDRRVVVPPFRGIDTEHAGCGKFC